MVVRFRDEGKSARVIVQLIEMNRGTGAKVVRLTLDSDDFPDQSGYQLQDVDECGGRAEPFDFVNNAYYIDATMPYLPHRTCRLV